jgi:hypothetical protein
MRKAGTIAILGVALTLAACAPGVNKTVAYSNDLVLVMLSRMSPDADLMPMARQFPNTNYRVERTDTGVTWIFTQEGADVCRFTAKVTPRDSKSSQVSTSLEDVSKGGERYICNVARIVGEESVAAAVEGRAADRQKVQSQLTRYMVSDIGGMTDSISKRMTEMAPPRSSDSSRYQSQPQPLPSGPVKPMAPLTPH